MDSFPKVYLVTITIFTYASKNKSFPYLINKTDHRRAQCIIEMKKKKKKKESYTQVHLSFDSDFPVSSEHQYHAQLASAAITWQNMCKCHFH